MSPKTTTPDLQDALDEQWDTISTGIGEEHPIEERPLIGNYLGSTTKELKDDEAESGIREQAVHQFVPKDAPDEVVFLWGSYELDAAMSKVTQGTLCRVTFTGYGQFKSESGPRQIKHFKVQTAK